MSAVLVKIAPVLLTFALGALLRRAGIFSKADADQFLKLFFYVVAPALFLRAVPHLDLSIHLIAIPLSGAFIDFAVYWLAWLAGKRLNLPRKTFGAFIIGTVIMNTGVLYPFIIPIYGPEGVAIASLFDFGHASVVFSFVYINACRYGRGNNQSVGTLFKKFISSPPLLAIIFGLMLNICSWELPYVAEEFIEILCGLVTPVMMIPLGIYFETQIPQPKLLLSSIVLRTVGGLCLGLLCVTVFDLHGLVRTVIILLSAAPSGILTLTYASMEDLDGELAASIVSYSTMIGLILIPLLITILPSI